MADRFADACLHVITDRELRAMPLVGSVERVVLYVRAEAQR